MCLANIWQAVFSTSQKSSAAIAPAVERTLGKGEVACSNHAGSTIFSVPVPSPSNSKWPCYSVVTLARCGDHDAFLFELHYLNLLMPTDQPAKLTDQTHRQQAKHQSPQTTLDVGPSRNIGHFMARNRHLLDGKFWGPFLSA